MSSRVAWRHIAPAGKHHPAAKWSLLMVLLAVVFLGVPNFATASPPSVQAPTGPQSGGVFTGTFTFGTYIYCSAGYSYTSSYSSSLDGTNTFTFYGAADGSLLVSINGGGRQLIDSCGDPATGQAQVASYTVTKGAAPTPAPTPPPTAAPTPTPAPASPPPSSGGGSSSSTAPPPAVSSGVVSQTPAPSATAATPMATPAPGAPAAPDATVTPSPAPTPTRAPVTALNNHPKPPTAAPNRATTAPDARIMAAAKVGSVGLLILIIILVLAWRFLRMRASLAAALRLLAMHLEPYLFRLRRFYDHYVPAAARAEPPYRGLSPHHHTGKLIAHHHTSYPALAFLVLVSAILAGAVSYSSSADSQLSLTVLGPPPTAAATIDQPTDGNHTIFNSQTVRGTCPAGLLVEIYRNSVFAGSTSCDSGGLYSILITLVPGANQLIAKDADALSQFGPNSNTVIVTYDAPLPTPTPSPIPKPSPIATTAPSPGATITPTPQPTPPPSAKPTPKPSGIPTPAPATPPAFIIDSGLHTIQGAHPSEQVSWQFQLKNGTGPYNIAINWGDGHTDVTTKYMAVTITSTHGYTQSGTYHVQARATDATGREATISVLAVINGAPAAAYTRPSEPPIIPIPIWPLLTFVALLVLSFWLGERHRRAIGRSRQVYS